MSEQTTLDDLKRAIADIPDLFAPGVFASDFYMRKSIAWSTAFEWLHEDVDRCCNRSEYEEGMALIREKLK